MIPPPSRVSVGDSVSASRFNQLVDYVLRTTPRPGANCRTEEKPNGTYIYCEPGGAQASGKELSPFTVRRHVIYENGDEKSAQWEIYLPAGCVVVRSPCGVINPNAADKTDLHHQNDAPAWHALPWPSDEEADKTYRVVVHGKQFVYIPEAEEDENQSQGQDPPAPDPSKVGPAVYVGVEEEGKDPLVETLTRNDYCGDVFNAIVATVRVVDAGDNKLGYRISQLISAPIVLQGVQSSTFDLCWTYTPPEQTTDRPSMDGISCLRQSFVAGGMSLAGESDADALGSTFKDKTFVWLKIDTSSGAFAIEVVENTESGIEATDELAWVRLYELVENRVVSDERQRLNQVPIYRGFAAAEEEPT